MKLKFPKIPKIPRHPKRRPLSPRRQEVLLVPSPGGSTAGEAARSGSETSSGVKEFRCVDDFPRHCRNVRVGRVEAHVSRGLVEGTAAQE